MKQATKKSATKKATATKGATAISGSAAGKSSTPKMKNDTQPGAGNGEQPGSLLEKFFNEQLKDIYYAELKILEALPKMEEACTTEELKEAFGDHRHQTQKHVKRLEKIFSLLGQKKEGKKCEAIEGIIKEAESIINDTKEGSMTRDAALIMAAQKVEHYEIATYGGLVQLAITLGQHEVSELLDQTLIEEEETDLMLTDIAEGHINMEAEEEALYSSNKSSSRKMAETIA